MCTVQELASTQAKKQSIRWIGVRNRVRTLLTGPATSFFFVHDFKMGWMHIALMIARRISMSVRKAIGREELDYSRFSTEPFVCETSDQHACMDGAEGFQNGASCLARAGSVWPAQHSIAFTPLRAWK